MLGRCRSGRRCKYVRRHGRAFGPAIHALLAALKTWMPGTRVYTRAGRRPAPGAGHEQRLNPASAAASQSLDQAGVDQQPIEASRLRTAGAEIEQTAAAVEH